MKILELPWCGIEKKGSQEIEKAGMLEEMSFIRPEDLPPDHVLQDGLEDSPFTKVLRNAWMRETLASLGILAVVFLCKLKLLVGDAAEELDS